MVVTLTSRPGLSARNHVEGVTNSAQGPAPHPHPNTGEMIVRTLVPRKNGGNVKLSRVHATPSSESGRHAPRRVEVVCRREPEAVMLPGGPVDSIALTWVLTLKQGFARLNIAQLTETGELGRHGENVVKNVESVPE